MTRGEAKNLRLKIETAARELDDAAAVSMIELFPRYGVGKKYAVGDRIYYDGKLYRVICEHTSQEDWAPQLTPALYAEMSDPLSEYPNWIQPAGAHNAYKTGDKVTHDGKRWSSDIDANVYEPGVYGWSEVT